MTKANYIMIHFYHMSLLEMIADLYVQNNKRVRQDVKNALSLLSAQSYCFFQDYVLKPIGVDFLMSNFSNAYYLIQEKYNYVRF